MDHEFTPYNFTFDTTEDPYDQKQHLPPFEPITIDFTPQDHQFHGEQLYQMLQASNMCVRCLETGTQFHFNQNVAHKQKRLSDKQIDTRFITVVSKTVKCDRQGCPNMICQKNKPNRKDKTQCHSPHHNLKIVLLYNNKGKTLFDLTFCSESCLFMHLVNDEDKDIRKIPDNIYANIETGGNQYVNGLISMIFEDIKKPVPETIKLVIMHRYYTELYNQIHTRTLNKSFSGNFISTKPLSSSDDDTDVEDE